MRDSRWVLSKRKEVLESRQGLGLRQSPGAFSHGATVLLTGSLPAESQAAAKAAEGCRIPRCWRDSAPARGVWAILKLLAVLALALAAPTRGLGADSAVRPAIPLEPNEARQAILRFRAPAGLKIDLFASEPLLANPVSFAFDEKGRAYVVETHRRRTSVYDLRNHPDWLDAELSFRTVTDRLKFLQSTLTPDNKSLPQNILRDLNGDGRFDFRDLEVESERVRLVEDRNGDGLADHAVTFAEGFNTVVSGAAAGVLVRQTNVWFACIPDLWLLRDTDSDARADVRQSLLHGFGVHIALGGHDLHGLCLGPDGKLYFSVGDRGFHVETGGRTVAHPDCGAVMRCNPDGSEFEVVATGLRNPQELAFDQFGNLWTGDNNGDGGDKARWVYVVEGSDSGWHIGWQHLPKLGPWNSERLWETSTNNTAAYVLPPVAHIGHGPAGLAFYPGTGLPPRYQNHFFLCDFPGGVRSFALKPKGAAYEVVDLHDFLWELYPVDVAFGPDGGAYVADWIQGWEKTGKGRIYRVYDPAVVKDSLVQETKKLLAEGTDHRSNRQLSRLLDHPDMRVRLEAQFALAARGDAVTNNLVQIAAKNDRLEARLHAIWALGQIGRVNPSVLPYLLPLLQQSDAEVRAQAAKVLGEGRAIDAFAPLVALLRDPHPRVRFFAAMSLGKLGRPDALSPVLGMLRENADRDPYLRHAGVMALVWLNDLQGLTFAGKDSSAAVRMAALLAMRKLARPEIASFLYDSNPALVLEAVRAIHDVPITNGLSQVASLISKPGIAEAALRRVLNANYRLGKLENALALADFAAKPTGPESLRAQALELLGQWANLPGRDWVIGLWRPLPPRDARGASLALRSVLPQLLKGGSEPIVTAAANTAAKLQITQVAPILFELVADAKQAAPVRLQALRALEILKDKKLVEAADIAAADPNDTLRKEAHRLLVKLKPDDTLTRVATLLEKGSVADQQSALQLLGSLDSNSKAAEQLLLSSLDRLRDGQVPKELQLDLLELAAKRPTPAVQQKVKDYEAGRAKASPLAAFQETLYGGDAAAGRKIFFERADVACLRCHKINGEGGDVGPDLSQIGAKQTREYLLESILDPSKTIAPGYETIAVILKSGGAYSGRLKNETEKELLLISPEDGLIVLGKNQIESRQRGLSAMPAEIAGLLSKRELRDLIEFLAQLK